MVRSLLIRGMLVGLVAGLAAFGFARWKGEPAVRKAIAFEDYVEYTLHHEPPEAEPVSRALQDSAGLGTGAILYGVALGGIFALVFSVAYGRMGLRTARGTSAVLGLLAFIGLFVVPLLKYPANPPSVGQPDTIGKRTALYLAMVLLSAAASSSGVTSPAGSASGTRRCWWGPATWWPC
jgi:Probable cobalt transporter subunit (CbtA)